MKTTVFTKYHIANGAKMAEFAGYNMPIRALPTTRPAPTKSNGKLKTESGKVIGF